MVGLRPARPALQAICPCRPGKPAFLTMVTACVASRRSIRKEWAEKRSGAYG